MKAASRIVAIIGAVAAILSAVGLASCGGGSTVASNTGGVGTGGTGIAFGTVTGFGSIVVDGTAFNSAAPQYFAGDDVSDAAVVAPTAVQLGARLKIQLDANGVPTTVDIEPELVGPIQNLGTNALTVNGVAVHLSTDAAAGPLTNYVGVSGAGGLADGMPVEVHGVYGEDSGGTPYILATLIQQLPSTTASRITGIVAGLNSATGSFTVDGTTVQLASGAQVLPADTTLADGDMVNIWSSSPVSGGAMTANVVQVRTLRNVSGSAQLSGLVSRLNGTSFEVSGIPVDASAANLATVVQSLATGSYVTVTGLCDPTTGHVVATSVLPFVQSHAVVELSGTITGYVGPQTFLVRGVPVDASQSGVVFSGGTATSLANGIYVEIKGVLNSSNIVTARDVTILPEAPEDSTVDYQGTVSQWNAQSGTFTLSWTEDGTAKSATVTLASNVVFTNGTSSDMADNLSVEVEGTNTASGLLANSVRILSATSSSGGSPSLQETSGYVYEYQQGGTSFVVNGLTFSINGSTQISGTLANGAKADVTFSVSGAQNVATSVEVDN